MLGSPPFLRELAGFPKGLYASSTMPERIINRSYTNSSMHKTPNLCCCNTLSDFVVEGMDDTPPG